MSLLPSAHTLCRLMRRYCHGDIFWEGTAARGRHLSASTLTAHRVMQLDNMHVQEPAVKTARRSGAWGRCSGSVLDLAASADASPAAALQALFLVHVLAAVDDGDSIVIMRVIVGSCGGVI